jgi:sensor histidine kinase YesM
MPGKLTFFFIRLQIAKTVLLLVFAVGCCLPDLFAQNPETTADDRLLNSGLKANAKVFITTDKTLTAEKVTSAAFRSNFKELPKRYFAKANETYWYLIDLDEVNLPDTEKWYVCFSYFDEITLYYQSGDTLATRMAGMKYKNKSPGVNDFSDIPFVAEELIKGRWLYAQIKHSSRKRLLADATYTNLYSIDFSKEYSSRSFFSGQIPFYLFIGGMLLMFLYFIGFYFIYNDRLFIYYSLYLLALILYIGARAQIIQEVFRNAMPDAIHIYNDVMQVFVNIFYLKFAQYVLNAKTDFPKLNVAIRYAIALLCTIVLLQLIILISNPFSAAEPYIIDFQRYFMIAFSLVSYVHILKNYKRKVVLFLVGGSLFYLTGALLALFLWEIKYMMLGTAIEVFIFSLILGYRTKLVEQEKKSIETEMTQVKLTALKAQMNPHFIFNSLNSIRAYVISNETKKASDYLNKFAKLIRLILHYSSKDTISLKEELETLALYIELEQMRYRDDFGFELKIAQGVDSEKWMVPPLILQPYVENAIGHGLAPKTGVKKLLVEITKSGNNISFTIRDNGVGRSFSKKISNLKDSKHKSVAMELTRKRINLAGENKTGDKNIEIIDLLEAGQPLGTEVRFKLPVRTE